MDYLPVNLCAKGQKAGRLFQHVIGPYDFWAIEYGYKPLPRRHRGRGRRVQKIAWRGAEPALDYATDEDAGGFDPDPLINRFDLGSDPVEFARRRVEMIDQIRRGWSRTRSRRAKAISTPAGRSAS